MTKPKAEVPFKCGHIVVIDDDDEIRQLLSTLLTDVGHTVVTTGDPIQAKALVREEKPDLVISDIAMPNLDGYGVLKALQSDAETARYPVIFLTARREFSERVRAFRFGAVDYLTKPFARDILLRKVERVLNRSAEGAGRITAEGPEAAREVLEDVRLEARSGVLTVKGEQGMSRVMVHAGEVLQDGMEATPAAASQVEFAELDPRREEILSHDPPSMVTGPNLPEFVDLPEALRTVLVVDDNEEFRTFLVRVMSSRGFNVLEASNGAQALSVALEQRPWLIVTDVNMPDADGVELCRNVRRHSLIGHTPIIFLSGWDDYKERYRGLQAGADDFLSKFSSVRELLIRVQVLLQRYSDMGAPQSGQSISGQLELVGVPGLLQMCHSGLLSGRLEVRAGASVFELAFREGEIASAKGPSGSGPEAVFDLLAQPTGQFTFEAGDANVEGSLGQSFHQILLEGCRRLDESQRPSE